MEMQEGLNIPLAFDPEKRQVSNAWRTAIKRAVDAQVAAKRNKL